MLTYSRYKKVLKDHNTYNKVLPILEEYYNKLQKFQDCDNIAVLVMMLELDIEEVKHLIDDCRARLFELEKDLYE